MSQVFDTCTLYKITIDSKFAYFSNLTEFSQGLPNFFPSLDPLIPLPRGFPLIELSNSWIGVPTLAAPRLFVV